MSWTLRTTHPGRSRSIGVGILLCLMMPMGAARGQAEPPGGRAESNVAVLEEVWRLVDEHFFDPAFNGADWPAMMDRYAPRVRAAANDGELADVINAMLDELDTSHTHYFAVQDPRYYQLLDVFTRLEMPPSVRRRLGGGEARYAATGIVAEELDGRVFVKGIIDGTPADRAGLLVGDEIISVDGEPFRPRECAKLDPGPPQVFRIQRTADPASEQDIEIARERVRPTEMFLRAMTASADVAEREGVKVGYVHIWSYAGLHYQQRLVELLQEEPLRSADALVLDIRDGWGGARTSYLNLFNRDLPQMTMKRRGQPPTTWDIQWRKPVVLLVNEGSRSGKEIIAYGFKAYGIGPVVGTRTGGAVTAGGPFLLANDALLYLAVGDVRVDGRRLEGEGVEPDIMVPFEVPYAAGVDPQRERAIEVAVEEVGKR